MRTEDLKMSEMVKKLQRNKKSAASKLLSSHYIYRAKGKRSNHRDHRERTRIS